MVEQADADAHCPGAGRAGGAPVMLVIVVKMPADARRRNLLPVVEMVPDSASALPLALAPSGKRRLHRYDVGARGRAIPPLVAVAALMQRDDCEATRRARWCCWCRCWR